MTHETLAPGIEIYNADCLDVMREMENGSVDLIVADPPYNIGKAEWDKIPDYIEWCGKWILECQRVLADNGSFYLFHNDMEQVADLMLWIRQNSEFIFKQFITWNKISETFSNNGFVQVRLSIDMMRNYCKGFTEYILFYTFQDETGLSMIHASKDCFRTIKLYLDSELDKSGYTQQTIKQVLDNGMASHYFGFSLRDKSQFKLPTKEMYNKLQSTGYFDREYEDLRREYEDLRREYEDLRREYEDLRYTFNNQNVKNDLRANSNVWLYPPAESNGHVTPKPVDLIENILLHSSNEGDVIFDPFAGSGSVGVACVKLNREYRGSEIDESYYNIAKRRIQEALMQPRLL
jgi:DNA modification methylase